MIKCYSLYTYAYHIYYILKRVNLSIAVSEINIYNSITYVTKSYMDDCKMGYNV